MTDTVPWVDRCRPETLDDVLIYHLFADDGVESEVLGGYGEVVRVGLDPRDNPYSEVITADATDPPLGKKADLVVAHPECGWWAMAPKSMYGPNDYPNQIPDARRVCRELGEHYIIENVPGAPLEDPVVLNGRMFRLPVIMERAFETSFPVPHPEVELLEEDPVWWWNEYSRPMDYWKSVKGYGQDHRKDPFVKSGIPRAYMDYLLRYWVLERERIDRRESEKVREVQPANEW